MHPLGKLCCNFARIFSMTYSDNTMKEQMRAQGRSLRQLACDDVREFISFFSDGFLPRYFHLEVSYSLPLASSSTWGFPLSYIDYYTNITNPCYPSYYTKRCAYGLLLDIPMQARLTILFFTRQ